MIEILWDDSTSSKEACDNYDYHKRETTDVENECLIDEN